MIKYDKKTDISYYIADKRIVYIWLNMIRKLISKVLQKLK